MGVAVDFRNTGVGVMVKVVIIVVDAAMARTVLNILRGKLLVAAMGAARWVLPIYVHLQQNGEIEADLEKKGREREWLECDYSMLNKLGF